MLTVNRLYLYVRYFHMAKNTGIERSKNNPIEIGKRGKVAYLAFQSIRIIIQCILKKNDIQCFSLPDFVGPL